MYTKELTYKYSICSNCLLYSSKYQVEIFFREKGKSKMSIHQIIRLKIKRFK